jgi:hypothetical protein
MEHMIGVLIGIGIYTIVALVLARLLKGHFRRRQ